MYHEANGFFEADDGSQLSPGFLTNVGFDNYREVFTDSEFLERFLRVFAWTVAFAVLSVVTCFALGLLLAVVFDDEHMRGRKLYRSLIIIPYALPGFMTALVWRGMLNETYGVNRWLPIDVPWLSTTIGAMFSLILVNMWLGYPVHVPRSAPGPCRASPRISRRRRTSTAPAGSRPSARSRSRCCWCRSARC